MDPKEGFQRKAHGFKGFQTIFSHIFIEFLVFACLCFHCHKTYFGVFVVTNGWKTT